MVVRGVEKQYCPDVAILVHITLSSHVLVWHFSRWPGCEAVVVHHPSSQGELVRYRFLAAWVLFVSCRASVALSNGPRWDIYRAVGALILPVKDVDTLMSSSSDW